MADSAACRILVLSSTLARAQQFVQRVKALSGEPQDAPSETDVAGTSVPWTIANKYYTADVHFETRELRAFAGHHASAVPAVVFVWDRGEAYEEHLPALAHTLQQHDPEVALAVRFGAKDGDEDDVDAFFAAHGFEYVDGDRADVDSAGVPGLPRVVDALSTIMWPSLVQTAPTRARRGLLSWADDSALLPHQPAPPSPMAREMAELEAWLTDDGAWATTPTVHAPDAPDGFEDDFAAYVGAPVEVEGLAPTHTGASWHTLASDLGEDEEEDEGLPTHGEVAETTRRIFGASLDVPRAAAHERVGGAADEPWGEFDGAFGEEGDGDEYEVRPFDLSRVFSALEGMKEEIAGITDEDERRKAAARVALGLVYGLQRENDVEAF